MCLQYESFENIVGQGEIARNNQFFLFHSVSYPFGEFEIVVCKLFQFGRV